MSDPNSKWLVFTPVEDGGYIHVVPNFGPRHKVSATTGDCWCHPERDTIRPTVISHNVFH